MERLILYYRRLKDLAIYSDTQMMELILVLVVGIINPLSLERLQSTPEIWIMGGIFLGLYLLWGVIENCIFKRFWATNLLFAHMIGIIAFESFGGDIQTSHVSYIIQAFVIGYITWKCGREYAYKCALKCRGEANNGK